jgi:hypothetical protein
MENEVRDRLVIELLEAIRAASNAVSKSMTRTLPYQQDWYLITQRARALREILPK